MKLFEAKAPRIMAQLIEDFQLSVTDAAAILGNIGHECAGFTQMHEVNPTVAGARGGLGWAQWTGGRRVAFEAYCKRNNLSPVGDKANYAWLYLELRGAEKAALAKLKAAKTLDEKVIAFERAYERAGIKHYPSRIKYAQRALEAWSKAGHVPPPPDIEPTPDAPQGWAIRLWRKLVGA